MLVIYFIAHSEWILQRSRADMARNLKSDFKIVSICPISEYKGIKGTKSTYKDQ